MKKLTRVHNKKKLNSTQKKNLNLISHLTKTLTSKLSNFLLNYKLKMLINYKLSSKPALLEQRQSSVVLSATSLSKVKTQKTFPSLSANTSSTENACRTTLNLRLTSSNFRFSVLKKVVVKRWQGRILRIVYPRINIRSSVNSLLTRLLMRTKVSLGALLLDALMPSGSKMKQNSNALSARKSTALSVEKLFIRM